MSAETEQIPLLNHSPMWLGISRGVAGFFGVLCLLDAARAMVIGSRSSDYGWIDLTPCPPDAARGVLAFVGVAMLLFMLTHRLPGIVRPSVLIGVMLLCAVGVANGVSIHRSIQQQEMLDGIPMPAHVVALLLPVIIGLIFAPKHGSLRFPAGFAVVVMGFVAAAFAFSVGYTSSLSKFHRPRAADAIVLMPPIEQTEEAIAKFESVANDLVKKGYSDRVVVVLPKHSSQLVPSAERLQAALPEGTIIRTTDDRPEVIGGPPNREATLLYVADIQEAGRLRLLASQNKNNACFVQASTRARYDESIFGNVKHLWSAWITPLQSSLNKDVNQDVGMSSPDGSLGEPSGSL